MFDSNAILRLYASVLHEHIVRCRIPDNDIRIGVRDMANAYAADPTSIENCIANRKFTDFNIPAFRCAYLHKYAPLHTYIVLDIMVKLLNENVTIFKNLLNSKQLNLCCLGGGPGSDAIGVLTALYASFTSLKSNVIIIDSMEQWKVTFSLILDHLKYSPGFGAEWINNIDWSYIGADLLIKMADTVNKAIGSASFITMVKFISAAICTDTESMVEKIFRIMKPGALVLYIDNAAGGFTQMILRARQKYSFKIIAGPFKHMEYSNEDLKIERFGYTSCFKTTVTIILLQKPFQKKNSPQRNLSSQNVLRDVQNINKVPSQNYITAQGKTNKTLFPHSNITPPSRSVSNTIQAPSSNVHVVRPINCENRNQPPSSNAHVVKPSRPIYREKRNPPPSSYTSAVTGNNLDFSRQYERFYSQSGSSFSTSPSSVVSYQPSTATTPRQISYSETTDDSNEDCCSCCVIS